MSRYQNTYTRNSHDWRASITRNGRIGFRRDPHGGVEFRVGLIYTFILEADHPVARAEILEYLEEVHSSYTMNDVVQPLNVLMKSGLIESFGNRRSTVYSASGVDLKRMARVVNLQAA